MVEVKVNSKQWNAVDTATQDQIVSTLKSEMKLPEDTKIVPSDDVPEVRQDDRQVAGFPGDILPKNPITDALCDAAAVAGLAACAKLSGPAYFACVAGVEAIRRDCKG